MILSFVCGFNSQKYLILFTTDTVAELLTILFAYFALTCTDHDQLCEKWQCLLTNAH